MLSEPAVGKAFFGREGILSILEKRVSALKSGYRQNVALTGQMLSGKSSILYQFLYTLKDSTLIPVYIEVTEESFPSFADRFIATLLYNYFISCSREAQKDPNSLLNMSEQLIPQTASAVKNVKSELSKKNYSEAYRKLLNLTSVLKKETGKSCVVILDEFHNLEYFRLKKPYLHFGKIIMIQKDTMYIVSSSQKSTIKKILSEKLALLFGNFEIIEVSGFDNKTAAAFLEEKLQNIAVPKCYAEYLIDFTDGNPFYLDAISRKIAEIANSRKALTVGEDIIIEALTDLIYNTNGTISQYFTNNIMNLLEKGLREGCLDILIALANGSNRLKDISSFFNKKNTAAFSAKLSKLIELDIVYKNGVFYEIHDKLFKFWLRTVYHRKKTALIEDIARKTEDFSKDVKLDINEYLCESRKDILERIKELFSLFDGETVEIEKRQRKLPKFLRIEFQRYGTREDIVTHQKSNRYWVCEVWRDKIDEPAVSEFIDRYRHMKDKITKKVCVALEGIDANALVLAKENNIWVWDIDTVNTLFRLYRKHNIVYK